MPVGTQSPFMVTLATVLLLGYELATLLDFLENSHLRWGPGIAEWFRGGIKGMVNSRTGVCKGPEAGRVRVTRNRVEHKEKVGWDVDRSWVSREAWQETGQLMPLGE